jgi:L-rhamnose mutarotase
MGYPSKKYSFPTKRYCQTLSLINDPDLIEEYKRIHSEENSWREIREGIRSVGILEMEIYIYGTIVCMIVDTPLDFNWEVAMEKLSHLPRQQEWEDRVSLIQQSSFGATSADKWHLMERFFHLYE